MNLHDLVPHLTPEQLAKCSVKIAIGWTSKKAKIAIVDENNVLVAERELKVDTAPTEPKTGTQGEYWQRHHNAWLD